MGILVGQQTKVLVQGITGREGSFHTKLMLDYGTKIVAGVTPGKGGLEVHGVPVYDSIREALESHPDINTSIVFVPARFAKDAVLEAIVNGLKIVVVITEHIPLHDELMMIRYAKLKGTIIIGPNTPGIINPHERCKIGIMPASSFRSGVVGLISRSGTLAYEVAKRLSDSHVGISTFVGLGGDSVVGLNMVEAIKLFSEDVQTKCIVIIGEIGGVMEERLADYLMTNPIEKPIIAFIAGKSAPKGKRMGHAGAIAYSGEGTAENKIKRLREVGVLIADTVNDITKLVIRSIEQGV